MITSLGNRRAMTEKGNISFVHYSIRFKIVSNGTENRRHRKLRPEGQEQFLPTERCKSKALRQISYFQIYHLRQSADGRSLF